jgi:hypothetical protein
MDPYSALGTPAPPTTPRRISAVSRLASLLARPDSLLMTGAQNAEFIRISEALGRNADVSREAYENLWRKHGRNDPNRVLLMIESDLEHLRQLLAVQEAAERGEASAPPQSPAATAATAAAEAAAAIAAAAAEAATRNSDQPLRSGLRSAADPRQHLAEKMGALKVAAEALKLAVTKENEWGIKRTHSGLETEMKAWKRVLDEAKRKKQLAVLELQQWEQQALAAYEEAMVARDDYKEAQDRAKVADQEAKAKARAAEDEAKAKARAAEERPKLKPEPLRPGLKPRRLKPRLKKRIWRC